MFDSLYRLSDLSIFLILATISVTFSVLAILICQKFIFHRLRYRDNQTIGSISSLIGIIYGVLVGFLALYLIDNNDRASDSVLREANSVANIYRDSQWLNPPTQKLIQSKLESYIDKVINVDWPAMRTGKEVGTEGDYIIQDLSTILKNYANSSGAGNIMMRDIITEVNTFYNARQARISLSGAQLTPELWEVVLIGTMLIIGINYAFRVNFYLHLFAISAFAIMAASMIFLLVTLDRPFQGEFIVEPDAFRAVLKLMRETDASQARVARLDQPRSRSYHHIPSFHKASALDPSERT